MDRIEERAILHKRQCARRLALQAMYQWHLTDEKLENLFIQYQEDDYWPKADHEYFKQLVSGCINQSTHIDQTIGTASDYDLEKIDPIELSALRIATFELMQCIEIPEKVVTAEAIRLCKKFGSDEGYKLVNAILDKLMKTFDRSQMLQKN